MGSTPDPVLRVPDFRRLVTATTLSQLGDRLTHMLLITVIAEARPGRLFGYAEGAMVFAVPTLLLCPIVGVLVDRWDKRRVLTVVHLIQSALLFLTPLAIWLFRSFVPFWVALPLFFGLDLFNNTASPALLPAIVGPDRILRANSVSTTFGRLATILGMVAGGFLVRWVGWNLGLVVDACTHLCAGLVALTIATRVAAAPTRPQTLRHTVFAALCRFGSELGDVLRLVGRSRIIGFVLGSIVVSTFIAAVSYTVLIYLIQQVLGLGTPGVGVFTGILAVGMVGGAVSMGLMPQSINRRFVILGTFFLYGLLFVVSWFHVSIRFMVVTALLAGLSFSWLSIAQNTVLQEETQADIRGRIFSIREFVTNATFIASTMVVGLFGDLASYRLVLPVIGIVLVVLAVLGYRLFLPKFTAGNGRRCCQ